MLTCTIRECPNPAHPGFLLCYTHGYELIRKRKREEKRRLLANAARKDGTKTKRK